MPCLTATRRAMSRHTVPAIPCRAEPYDDLRTPPNQAKPAIPCRAERIHAGSDQTFPRLRFHAMPKGNHAALASSSPALLKALSALATALRRTL